MKIQIYAMRSWGELGNIHAAKNLARNLIRIGIKDVSVTAADDLFERFNSIGQDIKKLTINSKDRYERFTAYCRLFDDLKKEFFEDFERETISNLPCNWNIHIMRDHISNCNADIIIGTKGVISRLCLAIVNNMIKKIPVFNYVTNHGLLELDIHRSKNIELNMVPFEESKKLLCEKYHYLTNRVKVVGPIIAGACAKRNTYTQKPHCILIFSNRGGKKYLDILKILIYKYKTIKFIFICQKDPSTLSGAFRVKKQHNLKHVSILKGMDQKRYLKLIEKLRIKYNIIFISKNSPNAVLEIVSHSIPIIALNSGLPMENWVARLIEDYEIGFCGTCIKDICEKIEHIIEDEKCYKKIIHNINEFIINNLDFNSALKNLRAIFLSKGNEL